VKLDDFGIARRPGLDAVGSMHGTVAYMAPEPQGKGKALEKPKKKGLEIGCM